MRFINQLGGHHLAGLKEFISFPGYLIFSMRGLLFALFGLGAVCAVQTNAISSCIAAAILIILIVLTKQQLQEHGSVSIEDTDTVEESPPLPRAALPIRQHQDKRAAKERTKELKRLRQKGQPMFMVNND